MLPDIGVMVGCYIVVRMLSLCNKKDESIIVRILAVITIIVAAFCTFDLIFQGTEVGGLLK